MSAFTIIPARPEHAAQLAPTMREADLAECLAAGYPSGLRALEVSLRASTEAWAVLFDGEIGALVGVDPAHNDDVPGCTLVWVLTGRAVDSARLSFYRASKRILSDLLCRHRLLFNLVDARYQASLDWLEVLGFTIGPVTPHPETSNPFRLVHIGRA